MLFRIIAEKELTYDKDIIWLLLIRIDNEFCVEANTLFYKLGNVEVWNQYQGEVVLQVLEKKLNTLKDFHTATDLLCQGYRLLTMQAMMLYIFTRFCQYDLYSLYWLRGEFGFYTEPLLEDLICLKYIADKDIHVYLLRNVKPVGKFSELKKEDGTYYVFQLNPGYP